MKIAVFTDIKSLFYMDGHWIDEREAMHIVTSSRGEFCGSDPNGTYVSWFGLPGPAAPQLNDVCLWFFRSGQWSVISIPLHSPQQCRTSYGGRYIDLGDIRLPPATTAASVEVGTRVAVPDRARPTETVIHREA